MLELGKQSEKLHREIGSQVANLPIDYLVAVGAQARHFIHGAVEGGFSQDHTFHFDKSEQAGKFIQDKMGEGDVILIKGSQGVRCEKITKELMAEPARAKELLRDNISRGCKLGVGYKRVGCSHCERSPKRRSEAIPKNPNNKIPMSNQI